MSEPAAKADTEEWREVNDYCITNGRYNITRSGKGERERFTLWNLQVEPARMEGIYLTGQEARKAAGDP